MATVNRGTLKKRINEGKMIAKCQYNYTDDYGFDKSNNFGKTEWMDARELKYKEVI